jgi:2-oxoglutarate dehydrogenase E2 component (dihydrolipoamide succinyltransferase)
MAGVAMPAAAKIMADNNLSAGSVAGSGKDGRVTKGDVLSAVAGGAKPAAQASIIMLESGAAPRRL